MHRYHLACGLALLFSLATIRAVHGQSEPRTGVEFFESRIRPVLVRECFGCHSDRTGRIRGGLRLDTRRQMLTGGDSGPAIVPGSPDESLLYLAMNHDGLAMPPKRKLSPRILSDFRQWITMGAPDPRRTAAVAVRSTVSPADVRRARESFWAYQPVEPQVPADVQHTDWPRTGIDRFVLTKLEESGLTPAADASPRALLRRLSFDLTGLPPTLEQVREFALQCEDGQPAAIDRAVENAVDRLLQQPQFGEHWGRHWLDVARYAESTGHGVNLTYPHAWRYRDYVIDAFNADKPYNEFVQEQIAGDLLPAKTDAIWAEQLVATTFLAIGARNINEMNSAQFRADQIDEQVDVTSRVFLGMSLACARCHDHKFDAIPQADYYAMAGFFSSTSTYFGSQLPSTNPMVQQDSGILEYPLDDPGPGQKRYTAAELQDLKARIDAITAQQRQATGSSYRGIQSRIYKGQLQNELEGVDDIGRPISFCMGVQCASVTGDATLLRHGEVDQPDRSVPRGFPSVLSTRSVRIGRNRSGRRELAAWLTADDHPLTARVMVNRIWQHMLGQGIVASPNDFGATGRPPSHPKLLDYLAARFVASGWSVKSLIRDIAVSRVYRLQAVDNADAAEFDPANSLLWRAHHRRLSAESIRDTMLAVSGQLDRRRPHGSEIAIAGFVRIRNGVLEDLSAGIGGMTGMGRMAGGMGPGTMRSGSSGRRIGPGGRGRGSSTPGGSRATTAILPPAHLDMVQATYRSVYLPLARNETPRSLDVFDGADSNTIVGQRATSNTADQALYLLNNPFVLQQADAFAGRLRSEARSTTEQIRLGFLLAYGRRPHAEEHRASLALLQDAGSRSGLTLFCQALLASAEFRYLD